MPSVRLADFKIHLLEHPVHNFFSLRGRNAGQNETYNGKLFIGILTETNLPGMWRVSLLLVTYQLSFVLSRGRKGNRECLLSASD